eukprot:gene7362-8759_t
MSTNVDELTDSSSGADSPHAYDFKKGFTTCCTRKIRNVVSRIGQGRQVDATLGCVVGTLSRGKLGADPSLSNYGSLEQTKVLMTTSLKRTDSANNPALFAFGDHFDFTRIIGRSPHSEVYEARSKKDSSLSAVKRSLKPLSGYSDRVRHMHEVEVFKECGEHRNIVKYYRCWQQEGYFYVQMELCEGGSLKERLLGSQQLPFDITWRLMKENDLTTYLRTEVPNMQVACGLAWLHQHQIVHLDIKPDNVFLDAAGTFKIGDFGLAVLQNKWQWEDGDGKYVAPELLNDDSVATSAADIYSFGCMLYECVVGNCLPRSPARAGRVHFPNNVPNNLCTIIQQMLANDPIQRPTADAVLQYAEEESPEGPDLFSSPIPTVRNISETLLRGSPSFELLRGSDRDLDRPKTSPLGNSRSNSSKLWIPDTMDEN